MTLTLEPPVREELIGLAPLFRKACSGEDLSPIRSRLVMRAAVNPDDAESLLDLSLLLQLAQHRELALSVQCEALKTRRLYRLPAHRQPTRIRVLALLAPGDLMANTPLELLVENSDVELQMLYVSPGMRIPDAAMDHDVVFVAISESDANRPLLAYLDETLRVWPRPVLNRPNRIARLSREDACATLASTPGVLMPVTARLGRAALEAAGQGRVPVSDLGCDLRYPIIARPVNSHAGHDLVRIDAAPDLERYLTTTDAREFSVARFVDYRSTDGQFRKLRIVLIGGAPYICHAAISEHWMIHYVNAGMMGSQAKRDEEARMMASFQQGFARRHASPLRAVHERLGLEYIGIDCAETQDGALLIFEVGNAMVVHAADPPALFPYKPLQMQKVFDAFRAMLLATIRPLPS